MAITLADFNKIWASTSPLTPYSFSESNYKQGWNFIGSTPPARQMWDFLQKNNDEKMQYLANNYLPLTGGTMTGYITLTNGRINNVNSDSYVQILGAISVTNGSVLTLSGGDRSTDSGAFAIKALSGSNSKELKGLPNGTLTWNGQPIQTSSDKRLKQDFSDVPADVLEAWGKVNWQQFKYKADVESKGVNNCRWHTGLVAQDVKEVGEENNVDLLRYGILCHDVREATDDSEAVDLWTVRYEEALAMEVIYLRNEIKKLREETKAYRAELIAKINELRTE